MQELLQQYGPTFGPIIQFLLLMGSGVGIAIGEDIVNIPAGILVAPMRNLLASIGTYPIGPRGWDVSWHQWELHWR